MSIVTYRSFSVLRYGRRTKILQTFKLEEHNSGVFDTSRHYHISLTRRLHIGSFKYYVKHKGATPLKSVSGINFGDCAKFASTFIVETPGKVANTAEPPPPTQQSVDTSTKAVDPIPEPPAIPVEEATKIVDVSSDIVQVVGEPSFASIGLGGWSPVGIVENCMEYLHVDCGMPWWSAIALGTVVVRMVLFPLVIIAQRNGAKMNNYLPQLQLLQMKMTEARQTGNHLEAARYAQEMMRFMKEKQLNPLKNMIVPLAQAPIFISFFMSLRSMANTPVPSFTTGGILWFQDLTMPDDYFLLPAITSATLALAIELGADSAKLSSQNAQLVKYVLRALPIVIFPFTMNFPTAVLCYWASSNFVSLFQVAFLRIPGVRQYFKIEPLVHHDPQTLPVKPKPFVEGFKESWTNMKITRQMQERERFDDIQFQKAGTAPLQKTFKYDPTRQRGAIAAKKRDDP